MSYPVTLYIYDLTKGMAQSFAPMLGLNFNVEGIWHTAIVVHGYEWFFGASGIEHCLPGSTMLGEPLKKEPLGHTQIDLATFSDYINGLSQDQFVGSKYDLFKHNCNNFSNVVSNFLVRKSIPQYILDLPEQFLRTPIASMLRPLIEQMAPHDVGPSSHDNPSGTSASAAASNASASSSTSTTNVNYKHFPVKDYQSFTTDINMEKLFAKLEEMNEKHGSLLTADDLQTMKQMGSETSGAKWWPKSRQALESWPGEDTFPILDLIRWRLAKAPIPDGVANELYQCLTNYLTKAASGLTPEPAIRLSLRIAANYFGHKNTRKVMLNERETFVGFMNDVVESLTGIEPATKREQSEIAAATIALNYAKAINDDVTGGDTAAEATFQLVSSLCFTFSQNIKSHEALYRTVVALGSLAAKHEDVKSLAIDLNVGAFFSQIPKNKLSKLDEAVTECKSLIR